MTLATMTSAQALGEFLRTLPASAAATFLALFPIVDPLGGVPIFFSMTSSWTEQDRRRTALKTGIWVFVILVTFLFFGRFVLLFFGISLPVIKIAGGLIVANTAWGMVTSTSRITPAETQEAESKEDISLTPLAMPLMSGPGAIGVVMALAAHVENAAAYLGMVVGVAAVALSVSLFFSLGGPLVKRLGPSAVGAINKIFGFLILAIAVQLIWNGMADFRN
jgi:multiple antibiotic resistance protein